jgi:LysR family transcriptional regulator, transcriptional activator for bauABCD operon
MAPKTSKFERNLDWNLLKVFTEIVSSRGVTRAASSLARQQPAVSNALKRLETHVGVVLCRRGPKGFELTDEGKAVARLCQRISELVSQIPGRVEDSTATLTGRLRLIMVQNLVSPVLDKTIADFNRLHPNVELLINIALLQEIEDVITREQAEIGVAPVEPKNVALRYDFLYREQHRPFCGRPHHLFGRTFNDPRDLSSETFILPGTEEAEAVTAYRAQFGWGHKSIAQSPYLEEVKRLVILGLGIGFLPEEMLETDIKLGLLWPLMAPQPDAQADILVITNPNAPRARAVQRFLDLLQTNQEHAPARLGSAAQDAR